MNYEALQKEGLLTISMVILPLGVNLIVNPDTLIAGAICLALGVLCIFGRGYLKTIKK